MGVATISMLRRLRQLENLREWNLGTWDRFNRLSGWRRGAFINTVLVSAVFVVLISSHIFLWAKSKSPAGYHIIHSGRCAGNSVGRLNTVLHLIINILSTLVLASTNFFMQVLNAPSRAELDSAHEKGSWLDIGVPSPRNAFRVSRFKTIMWILFFLSSVPIHILFNSVIFATDDRGSEFSYFAFDESVLTGGATFDPGTSLALPYVSTYPYSSTNMTHTELARQDFEANHTDRSRIISATVEEMLENKWDKLDNSDCVSIYNTSSCSGLRSYRNVALILRGSTGWNRSQVWDLPANEISFWDEYVPKDVNNSLWFAHISKNSQYSCRMDLRSTSVDNSVGSRLYCDNGCSWDMGLDDTLNTVDTWTYPLFSSAIESNEIVSSSPAPEFEDSRVSVEYCLAEPLETICQIGLASTLLWVVSCWYVSSTLLSDALSCSSGRRCIDC